MKQKRRLQPCRGLILIMLCLVTGISLTSSRRPLPELQSELFEWIRGSGGYVSDSQLALHRYCTGGDGDDDETQRGGIGVIALVSIPPAVDLVRIPQKLQLSSSSGSPGCEFEGSDEWHRVFKTLDAGSLTLRSELAFASLCLVHHRHDATRSPFQTYLSLLPDNVPNAMLYYESTSLLSGYRPFVESAEMIRGDVEVIIQKIHEECKGVTLNRCLNVDASVDVDEVLRWAVSIVTSRAFLSGTRKKNTGQQASGSEGDYQEIGNYVLSPFDFFDHAPTEQGRNVRSRFEACGDFVLTTTRQISAGEELLLMYGPRLANTALATQYGFVLEDNPHDVLGIAFAPDKHDPNAELKRRILRDALHFHRGTVQRGYASDGVQVSAETLVALLLVSLQPEDMTALNVGRVLSGRAVGMQNRIDSILLLRDACSMYAEALASSYVANDSNGIDEVDRSPQERATDVVMQYRSSLRQLALDCVKWVNVIFR